MESSWCVSHPLFDDQGYQIVLVDYEMCRQREKSRALTTTTKPPRRVYDKLAGVDC